MQFKIIATDLDGTIALNDKVDSKTWNVLEQAKKAGFKVILVTGRRLNDITQIGPFDDLCEAIVAEDGAAIFFPATNSVILPFGQVAPEVILELQSLQIPFEKGMAIASTWIPHDQAIAKVLATTGYAAHMEFNKGAVMIMPPGATKGSGLSIAVRELGYSIHNVVSFGDAENDRSLFDQSELSVAVSNATQSIKELADISLSESNGQGVRNFIQKLMAGKIPKYLKARPTRQITLGQMKHSNLALNPLTFTMKNLGIFGASGTGKSWLSGLLAEEMMRLEYQLFIIDPEGDYRSMRAFPNTIVVGGNGSALPSAIEVSKLLEYSSMSLVLDLSQYESAGRIEYVTELVPMINELRRSRGKPHWILIDEIHYFCGANESALTQLMATTMHDGGLAVVTYKPSELASEVSSQLNHIMLLRFDDSTEVDALKELDNEQISHCISKSQLVAMNEKQVYFHLDYAKGDCESLSGVIEFDQTHRRVPHIRHLHKYLRAPLPIDKQFYFKGPQNGFDQKASSLFDFLMAIPSLSIETLKYHLSRGDFEAWFREVLHDEELAKRIRKIANRKTPSKWLRAVITEAVTSRYQELEKMI